MKSKATFGKSIIEENLQYIWVLLGFATLVLLLVVGVSISEGKSLALKLDDIIFVASIVVIPLFAVNTIFLFKHFGLPYFPGKRKVLILKMAGLFLGITVGTLVFEAIYTANGIYDDDYIVLGSFTLSTTASEVVSNLFFAALVGIPIFIKQQVRQSSSLALAAKVEELEKANRLNVKSQLEALQARVNPHFLYNSLNSIASLIHINPDQAEEMVLSLSELFRYSLNSGNEQLSTINEEIKMVETYFGIEQIRFGDKLTCHIELDKEIGQVLIPRFLLQPIVENAIKHGTSKIGSGKITVNVRKEEDNIHFEIADNGPNFPNTFEVGYGLKCVTDQLNLLYKDQHLFEMVNTPKKQVKIVLKNILNNA